MIPGTNRVYTAHIIYSCVGRQTNRRTDGQASVNLCNAKTQFCASIRVNTAETKENYRIRDAFHTALHSEASGELRCIG